MVQKFDIRQSVSRDFLDQLTLNSDYTAAVAGGKDANSTEVDNLLRSINDELTVPLRMSASTTFSISKETFELFKMKTREFRKELLELARLDEKPGQVFQYTFNLFPVSGAIDEDAE